MSQEEELPPSKLGTKEHWDMVYERENRVFDDVGDEGEIWFGEDSVYKMRLWAHDNLPLNGSTPTRVLECGSGNGTLLLSFLTSPGPDATPQAFHLTGIDYSAGAASLAASVEKSRRTAIAEGDEDVIDIDDVVNSCQTEWRVGDLLRDNLDETWDLVMDKGTFDALALSQDPVEGDGRLPSLVYPEKVAQLVRPGGFFLITSCNFTEEETKRRFTRDTGLVFHSSVPHKSFSFGGSTGQTVCTVAFMKTDPATAAAAAAQPEEFVLSVDCGGTKTEAVIASRRGVRARAVGGTGNMAEVGVERSSAVIKTTVLEAINSLFPDTPIDTAAPTCPLAFRDIWIGISGCDTPRDAASMRSALAPFFNHPHELNVQNDALLLGGTLLTHDAPWGVAVIAGTGSIAVVLQVTPEGVGAGPRRGGHGYLLGDDGSAYDIGRCAIRAAVNAFDAGEERQDGGGLAKEIRAAMGVHETGELLAKVHELDTTLDPYAAANKQKLRITSLARAVLEHFSTTPPDPVAVTAIHDAARPLAASIIALVRQLWGMSLDAHAKASMNQAMLVCGGGVIRQDKYRAVIVGMLKEEGVEFGRVEVTDDVGGEAALGLVAKMDLQR